MIDDRELIARLGGIADYALTHDRQIANRVDDSVVRVIGGRAAAAAARPRLRAGADPAAARVSRPRRSIVAMGGELKSDVLPGQGRQGDAVAASSATSTTPRPSTITAGTRPLRRRCSTTPARARGRPASRIPARRSWPRPGARRERCRSSRCSITTPMSPPASPRTAGRSTRRRCWGSCSTGSAGAMTGRSGAASSCSPTIAAIGGSAASSRSRCPAATHAAREPWRNLYAHLTAEMGWAELTMNFGRARGASRPRRAAARDARRDDPHRHQRAARPRPAAACSTRWRRRSASAASARPRGRGRRAARSDGLRRKPARRGRRARPTRSRSRNLPRLGPALCRAAGDVARAPRRPDPRRRRPRSSRRGSTRASPRSSPRWRETPPATAALRHGRAVRRLLPEQGPVRRGRCAPRRRRLHRARATRTVPPTTAASRSARRRSRRRG